MALGLELAQLLEHDDVAEVDVRGRGIDPELDSQRLALGEALGERALGQDVDRSEGQTPRLGLENRGSGHEPNARLAPG